MHPRYFRKIRLSFIERKKSQNQSQLDLLIFSEVMESVRKLSRFTDLTMKNGLVRLNSPL